MTPKLRRPPRLSPTAFMRELVACLRADPSPNAYTITTAERAAAEASEREVDKRLTAAGC